MYVIRIHSLFCTHNINVTCPAFCLFPYLFEQPNSAPNLTNGVLDARAASNFIFFYTECYADEITESTAQNRKVDLCSFYLLASSISSFFFSWSISLRRLFGKLIWIINFSFIAIELYKYYLILIPIVVFYIKKNKFF